MLEDRIQLYHVYRQLAKVNKLKNKMRQMSDDELKGQTAILKKAIADGKSLNSILPQAFATIREADYRILGMFPYDVQVMGGIVLHSGNIAEMKTGEGKTLTATMPLYLNALSGKGAMLVTPNSYLAARDEKQLQPVYNWLGLTATTAFENDPDRAEQKKISPATKRKWYQHDIVYTTGSGLAFDYLFDNLAASKEQQYLRPFNYAIIDEVDDVFLDEATQPFVVASSPMLQSSLYKLADDFVSSLVKGQDYKIRREDKAIWLTYVGVMKAQHYFRIKNLFDEGSREIYRHIALSLQAHFFMRNGRDYLVRDGKVVLLDEANGRLKNGVRVNTGLHQAIEQKEGVEITPNELTAASITFPSLFGLFNNVAGMSGTAKTDEAEFMEVYKMRVIPIPTRKPVIRKDYPDEIYVSTSEKLFQAINYALALHKQGRPILLVAGSVENSEIISEILLNHGIAHNVLNAFNAAHEAEIVKDAGQKGAVTVATNMAGRGTDIKLGPGVKELGGLAVIGTEMLPERVKLQLAGRAGRQGDPGSSKFFISLEDSYIAKGSTKRFRKFYRRIAENHQAVKQAGTPHQINNPRLSASLAMLKARVGGQKRSQRKQVNRGEMALRFQRENFYRERKYLMSADHLEEMVQKWLLEGIDYYLDQKRRWTVNDLKAVINQHFSYDPVTVPQSAVKNRRSAERFLLNLSTKILHQKGAELINNKQLNDFYRSALLSALDHYWMQQMDYLSNLRSYVQPFANAGRDPSFEYQERAFNAFKKMLLKAKVLSIDNLLLSHISVNKKNELVVYYN